MGRMEFSMEKVCVLNAISVFQILRKVRNKEPEYNRTLVLNATPLCS